MVMALTTDPTLPTLPAGEGCGDIGDGVPLLRLLFHVDDVEDVTALAEVWLHGGWYGDGTLLTLDRVADD